MSGRGCVMNCCMIKGLHIWKTWTLTVHTTLCIYNACCMRRRARLSLPRRVVVTLKASAFVGWDGEVTPSLNLHHR